MMKKLVITWVVICITILLGVNLFKGLISEPTNDEIMEQYINENYSEGCFGEMTYCDEEYISFMVYDEYGMERCLASVTTEFYRK